MPPSNKPIQPPLFSDPAAQKAQLEAAYAEAEKYIQDTEALAAQAFKEEFKRDPSPSEIQQLAHSFAEQEGVDYFGRKNLLATRPGPVRRTLQTAADLVGSVATPILRGAVAAVADRTQSLRSQDSSLPSLSFEIPQYGPDPNAESKPSLFGLGPNRLPLTRTAPAQFHFGAEELADTIELGGPMAAETAILGLKNMGIPGKMASMVLSNVATEVGAEYLRYVNAKASGVPTAVPDTSDPTDVALHFMKVATGGAILGAGDIALNSGQLRLQRQAYKRILGLGTPESTAAIKRLERLGVEPSLAQAMTGIFKPMTVALSVYPMTGIKGLERSRKLVQSIYDKAGSAFDRIGDRLVAGVPLTERSKWWLKANDKALQYNRVQAGKIYDSLEQGLREAEQRFGRDNVYVDHEPVRNFVQDLVNKNMGELPLVRTNDPQNPWRVAKAPLSEKSDAQLLVDILNMEGKPSPVDYMHFRNLLDAAAERAAGANDTEGRIFALAAAKMREALSNMTAPAEVRSQFEAAQRLWGDYNTLFNSSAWKHFRAADPEFGYAGKVSTKKPSTSAEVVLQNALNDPDLSPEVVNTWYSVAKEGGAESQFRGAIQSHLESVLAASSKIPDKGPLAGVETINLKAFMDALGLNDPESARWAAHRVMINKAGGDATAFRAFLEDAARAFPDGIVDPSKTAARRTGLAGIGSAVRFVTGASVLAAGTTAGRPDIGILGAVASFMAMKGVGHLAFNPAVLKKMRMVMDGGISEQGRWRTLWTVVKSVGMTRAFQSMLQEQGIDPMETPLKADRYEQTEDLMNRRPYFSKLRDPGIYPRK